MVHGYGWGWYCLLSLAKEEQSCLGSLAHLAFRASEEAGGDEKTVCVEVAMGSSPYAYDGRPYVRQGPTTSIMPQSRYEHLLEERMHPTQRWELLPAYKFSLDDLDYAEITCTVDEAIRRGRMDELGTRDLETLLLGLGLVRDEQLLNAAVVLFGKTDHLLPYYPQCLLRIARFRGTTKNEFEEQAGAVIVRFRPTRYVPPSRVSHNLSPLHQDLLRVLADLGTAPLSEIEGRLRMQAATRTVQKALAMLQELGLAELRGHGRGARWMLRGHGRGARWMLKGEQDKGA